MTKGGQSLMLFVMAAAVALGLTLWRMGLLSLQRVEMPPAISAEALPGSSSEPAPEPAVLFPLDSSRSMLPMAAYDLRAALEALLGREAVATFFQLEDFPRRVVATIDNLGRSHAPWLLWPVTPAPDRFLVEVHEGVPVIAADNSARYTPFVRMVESIDAGAAGDVYVRLYPLLQRAYGELGFPNSYFNDRVIAVIDVLLATPEVEYPVRLQLTEVKGPIPSLRPWTRYEFADPALESLSSGQKMLLRMGSVNERHLKAKLAEFRAEIIRRTLKR